MGKARLMQAVLSNDVSVAEPRSAVGSVRSVGKIEQVPIVESNGVVLTRVGDQVWDFRTLVATPNATQGDLRFEWPEHLPSLLVSDAKRALFIWMKFGRPGTRLPSPTSVAKRTTAAIQCLKHFSGAGLQSFADIRPIHVADYQRHLKVEKGLSPARLTFLLSILDLVWLFREDLEAPPQEDPFADLSLTEMSGANREYAQGFTAKTPVIPPSVLGPLFATASSIVDQAEDAVRSGGNFPADVTCVRNL